MSPQSIHSSANGTKQGRGQGTEGEGCGLARVCVCQRERQRGSDVERGGTGLSAFSVWSIRTKELVA